MPRAKKATKRTKIELPPAEPVMEFTPPVAPEQKNGVKPTWLLAGVAVVVAIFLLVKQGYIVSAVVNGKPIFRWDVNRILMAKYGKQAIENLITENLIADAAAKGGATVTKKDLDDKAAEIVKSFGGTVSIDDLLKFQGMTRAEFDEQLKVQILVTKLLGKDVVVDEKEITDYIEKNKTTLTATDEAGLKAEAKDAVFQQKLTEKVQPWFTDLKAKAQIVRFP